ncbi:MAG: SurA N-terminal domain-containing protein [Xanthomonadaceae bacterium]|nr:SurA N-terminal domain-containing protein [Xanthomonadaceae bacterium]
MLQALREKSSGWVATVILGLLIVPFALFGVSDYMTGSAENYAARIQSPPSWWKSAPSFWPVSVFWGDEEISVQEYRERLEQVRQQQRAQQGEAFDNKAFESTDNKRKILESMIDERLMRMAAANAGMEISNAEVRREIAKIPEFQVDGRFNDQKYVSLLASLNPPRTAVQFEADLRNDLQRNALVGRTALSAFTPKAEGERMLALWFEQRDLSVVRIPMAVDAAPVSDVDIDAWYRSHTSEYRAPESVTLEYIEVEAAKLPPAPVNEADLRARYAAEGDKFGEAEQRKVSHILVPVASGADAAAQKAAQDKAAALAQQANGGADFAQLARANSGDPGSKAQGGDLGWISRGSGMPKPFEDAVFALQAGQVSAPVKSDFGWHVIKLDEVKAGTRKTFEEARAQLEAEATASAGERAYNDLLSALVDDLMKNPSGFAEAAAKHGLIVQKTGPVPKGGGEGIAASPAVQRDAFSEVRIQDGTVSDPIDIGTDHSVLLRVVEHTPERAIPLAQVRDRVIADIRADRAGKATADAAKAMAAAAGKGESLATLASARGLSVEPFKGVTRNAPAPTPEATKAVFDAPRPQPDKPSTGAVVLPDGSWMVFKIDAVTPANPAEVPPAQLAGMREQLSAAAAEQTAKAYVAELRKHHKIRVVETQL